MIYMGLHQVKYTECLENREEGVVKGRRSSKYFRDKNKGLDIKIPFNYFPDNDTTKKPPITWRSTGILLFTNWLNYFVYQRTPYDLANL